MQEAQGFELSSEEVPKFGWGCRTCVALTGFLHSPAFQTLVTF